MTDSKKKLNIFVKALMLLWYCTSQPIIWVFKKLYHFFANLNYRRIGSRTVRTIGNFLHWVIFNVLLPKRHRGISKKEIYRIIFRSI